VPAQQVEMIPDEQEAVGAALRMARPGDLLLVFADALTRTWNQVVHFHTPTESADGAGTAPAAVEPGGTDADLEDGPALIRDERGVRLARETEVTD